VRGLEQSRLGRRLDVCPTIFSPIRLNVACVFTPRRIRDVVFHLVMARIVAIHFLRKVRGLPHRGDKPAQLGTEKVIKIMYLNLTYRYLQKELF
jgi:hypothetical protein